MCRTTTTTTTAAAAATATPRLPYHTKTWTPGTSGGGSCHGTNYTTKRLGTRARRRIGQDARQDLAPIVSADKILLTN